MESFLRVLVSSCRRVFASPFLGIFVSSFFVSSCFTKLLRYFVSANFDFSAFSFLRVLVSSSFL